MDAVDFLAGSSIKISFEGVTFAYDSKPSKATISDVNLTVETGQTLALVGESGSGKSTILKLLLRLYETQMGSIKLDDKAIEGITLSSLRESFSIVPQQAVLFNTSVRNNILYGRLNGTQAEIEEACKAACIHNNIMQLANGYDTRVGERGAKLSGGEVQRIAIARAILRDAPVFLLDEATSNLDSATETKVQKALTSLSKRKATVIVAHKLSTVMHADCIHVMDQGKIVERGTHGELLELEGKYAALWNLQVEVAER